MDARVAGVVDFARGKRAPAARVLLILRGGMDARVAGVCVWGGGIDARGAGIMMG